jgi:hypothetical protein
MFSPPNIPNQFPPPQGQGLQEEKKSLLTEILSSVVLSLILVGLVVLIAWIIIAGISGVGGGLGSTVMDWVNQASINPENERGFTFFLRLLLTAGFIGLVVAFLKKNQGDRNE